MVCCVSTLKRNVDVNPLISLTHSVIESFAGTVSFFALSSVFRPCAMKLRCQMQANAWVSRRLAVLPPKI